MTLWMALWFKAILRLCCRESNTAATVSSVALGVYRCAFRLGCYLDPDDPSRRKLYRAVERVSEDYSEKILASAYYLPASSALATLVIQNQGLQVFHAIRLRSVLGRPALLRPPFSLILAYTFFSYSSGHNKHPICWTAYHADQQMGCGSISSLSMRSVLTLQTPSRAFRG